MSQRWWMPISTSAGAAAGFRAPSLFRPRPPGTRHGGTVSLQDDPTRHVFMVTMENLTVEDGDQYWCGIQVAWFDPMFPVMVSVLPGKHLAWLFCFDGGWRGRGNEERGAWEGGRGEPGMKEIPPAAFGDPPASPTLLPWCTQPPRGHAWCFPAAPHHLPAGSLWGPEAPSHQPQPQPRTR